jgi:hypothetical protein
MTDDQRNDPRGEALPEPETGDPASAGERAGAPGDFDR